MVLAYVDDRFIYFIICIKKIEVTEIEHIG